MRKMIFVLILLVALGLNVNAGIITNNEPQLGVDYKSDLITLIGWSNCEAPAYYPSPGATCNFSIDIANIGSPYAVIPHAFHQLDIQGYSYYRVETPEMQGLTGSLGYFRYEFTYPAEIADTCEFYAQYPDFDVYTCPFSGGADIYDDVRELEEYNNKTHLSYWYVYPTAKNTDWKEVNKTIKALESGKKLKNTKLIKTPNKEIKKAKITIKTKKSKKSLVIRAH